MVFTMTYRAVVYGASGYGGAELLKLLAGHPEIEVAAVAAESNAGATVGSLFPALGPVYGDMVYAPSTAATAADADIAFLALPHGASQRLVPELLETVDHIVDFGADFRLPPDVYEHWYGEAHEAPELLDQFAYGMVELFRSDIVSRRHVAVPGCYPTAASLALAPVLAAGLVDPARVVVNALSGVSGAGRALKLTSHFSEVNESALAYGLLTHRHTAEVHQALDHVSPADAAPVQALFTPHLVPMTRGIVATCTAPAVASALTTADLLDRYREFYAGEAFVRVTGEPSGTRATYGSNSVHITVRYDERTDTVLAVGVLDNMVKGAAGQALQNANLVLGLPEIMSLPTLGVAP